MKPLTLLLLALLTGCASDMSRLIQDLDHADCPAWEIRQSSEYVTARCSE